MGDPAGFREGLRSNTPATNQKPSAQQLFNTLRHAILSATQPTSLEYGDIDTETGTLIIDSLDQTGEIENIRPRLGYNSLTKILEVHIMPTFIHDAPQTWMADELTEIYKAEFLTDADRANLFTTSGSTFHTFQGLYAGSRKQPDWYLCPHTQNLPSIVFEIGWTESRVKLYQDMNLWLIGGSGQVQLVFLFNWSKLVGGRIKGDVEIWDLDPAGNPRMLHSRTMFPSSPAIANQTIPITRRQLMGNALPPGRNPDETFDLSMARLRQGARLLMLREGFNPA